MKKKILSSLIFVGMLVGCGIGGGSKMDNWIQTTGNDTNLGETKQSLNVSELKGHTVIIEDFPPITTEIKFFCNGGYMLSRIIPNSEPWVIEEYHKPMMHATASKLYLWREFEYRYVLSDGVGVIKDRYKITLFDGDIIVGESTYNPSNFIDYKIIGIKKVATCESNYLE